jgi:restriction system protein
VPIEAFRNTVEHIFREGAVSRKHVNDEYVRRGSSGVMLILSKVPLFEEVRHPQQQLRLKGNGR